MIPLCEPLNGSIYEVAYRTFIKAFFLRA